MFEDDVLPRFEEDVTVRDGEPVTVVVRVPAGVPVAGVPGGRTGRRLRA